MSAVRAIDLSCKCFSTTDNQGILHPTLCETHATELQAALGGFHWVTVKYQRYFETEADANDRALIIRNKWPAEAYSTTVSIIPVSRWWLLRASWSDSAD